MPHNTNTKESCRTHGLKNTQILSQHCVIKYILNILNFEPYLLTEKSFQYVNLKTESTTFI